MDDHRSTKLASLSILIQHHGLPVVSLQEHFQMIVTLVSSGMISLVFENGGILAMHACSTRRAPMRVISL
jgi:hypothetical protein